MTLPLSLSAGALFTQDFRIIRPLGEGGMGQLYVVEQLSTGEERALKLMQPKLVEDPKARERFVQEARVGARIKSEHVVKVLGAGVEEGTPWLVMELLDGQPLDAYVRQRPARRLTVDELRPLYRQLGHALGAAHRQGIVHRDLKPENLFRAEAHSADRDYLLKILDFGIAKIKRDAETTGHTAAIGSPLWMAPEQLDADGSITPATDVWALGLIAFWLLTGQSYWLTPSRANSSLARVVTEIITRDLVPASARAAELGIPPLLPAWFDGWFARCVARDPAARFADAAVAQQALEEAIDDPSRASLQPAASVPSPGAPTAAPASPPHAGPSPLAGAPGTLLRLPTFSPAAADLPSPAAAAAPRDSAPSTPLGSQTQLSLGQTFQPEITDPAAPAAKRPNQLPGKKIAGGVVVASLAAFLVLRAVSGGEKAPDPPPAAAVSAAADPQAADRTTLDAARKSLDSRDYTAAAALLSAIPESAGARQLPDYATLWNQWADGLQAEADKATDPASKRAALGKIADAAAVDVHRRAQAVAALAQLDRASDPGPPPGGAGRSPSNPKDPSPPLPDRRSSATKASPGGGVANGGNEAKDLKTDATIKTAKPRTPPQSKANDDPYN